MTQHELIREFLSLATEEQRRVTDFITSLKQKNQSATPSEVPQPIDFSRNPFIGMWKDRQDLADSSDWVRNLRRNAR